MKKILFSLLIVMLLIVTGCGKKEEAIDNNKKEESKEETKTKPTTNNKIGDLSYYIPDTLRFNKTSTDNTRIYEITNDTTNISVWVVRKENITEDIETYIKNDNWNDSEAKYDKQEYNGQVWYIIPRDSFIMYTKYNNDIYKIRFSVLEDGSNYVNNLKRIIPNSLIFE